MEVNFTLDTIGAAAKALAPFLQTRKVVALHGEMGAGKTTFVHALCLELGVKDHTGSPTYSIINEYRTTDGTIIYHMDLYRLRDEEEALNAGVEDCLYSGSVCLAEWPERAPGIFPDTTLHVTITIGDNNLRKIQW